MLELGFHKLITAKRYHADDLLDEPTLSSSIAAEIISKTPRLAMMKHPRLSPAFESEEDSKFDLGQAVHDFLASGGASVMVVPYLDYRSKAAQAARDEARSAGMTPLTEPQGEQVRAIVASVRKQLEKRGIDLGEQEAVFLAEDHGVKLRAMMDSWNPPWISDFKITGINLANDWTVGNHIVDCAYDLKAAFYLHVAGKVFPHLAGRLKFRWLMVEKDEPYGMRVVEADSTCLEMGRRKMNHAIALWQKCLASGFWPHFEYLPPTVPYPNFAETRWLEREEKPDYLMGPMEALKRMDRGEAL